MVINLLGPIHSSTLVLLPAREIFILRSQRTRMQILPSIQQNQGHSCSHSSPTSCPKALLTLLQECRHKTFVQSGDSTVVSCWNSLQHGYSLNRSWKAFHFYTLFALASRLITSSLSEPLRWNFAIRRQMNSIIIIFISSLKRAYSFLHSLLSLCAQ